MGTALDEVGVIWFESEIEWSEINTLGVASYLTQEFIFHTMA